MTEDIGQIGQGSAESCYLQTFRLDLLLQYFGDLVGTLLSLRVVHSLSLEPLLCRAIEPPYGIAIPDVLYPFHCKMPENNQLTHVSNIGTLVQLKANSTKTSLD